MTVFEEVTAPGQEIVQLTTSCKSTTSQFHSSIFVQIILLVMTGRFCCFWTEPTQQFAPLFSLEDPVC